LKTILRFKQMTKSLFIRLFASFMLIILLLASFNYLSLTFFREQVQEEIITYNSLNMKQTADGYETHIQLLSNMVLGFFSSESVQILNKNAESYITTQIRAEIRNMVSNPLLYMDNLVLFFKDRNFILEKEGSTTADTMFNKFYSNDNYPFEFWQAQFDTPSYFTIYPAANFREESFRGNFTSRGKLFPITLKNKLYPGLYMIAFIDADKVFKAFHRSINENFLILDTQGNVMYTTLTEPPGALGSLPAMPEKQGYIRQGDSYYFYYKGGSTGLTYVNVVSNQELGAKVSRLNFTLLSVLLIAIAIGVGTSLLFSIRFNNPVKKIIDSIRQLNTDEAGGMSTNEFEQINSTIHQMFKTNHDIHKVLHEKNSLLKHYAYTNKVKNIDGNVDFKDLGQQEQDGPFRFVLFQLFFTEMFHDEAEVNVARATYFLREIIRQYMSTSFKETHTFQVENDQILTVVFMNEQEPSVDQVLLRLKEVLGHDTPYCFSTMALGPVYGHSTDFTAAYELVLELSSARLLNADIQIIEHGDASGKKEERLAMNPSQEQEFEANLRNGNDSVVIPLVKRLLGAAAKKEETAARIKQFAEDLIDKTIKVLVLLQIDYKSGIDMQSLYRSVRDSHTLEQLEALMEQTLAGACRLIGERKEQRDPMVSFVLDYLEFHYNEDITLDSVAGKLDISGGYLSTYFKEKTGNNFIDYVHEVRINKAKELLLHADLKIQDTAAKVGYHNLNSFNRMFKKYTGMTPSEFKKQQLG
jgi:two-component system response regulator YesN